MRAAAISLMIGLGFSSLAQETETILYNMATSGLNLRSQPKSQSRIVTKIPYGTKMKIQERTGITGKSGWIEDEWLKVEFRGRTGFVFAGYLSEMKAPEKVKKSGSLTTALREFAERAFKIEREALETLEGVNLHCYQPFKGQVELETETENGLTSVTLTFSSTDVFDAYVLLEALLYWNDDLALLDALRFVKGKDGKISKINDSEGLIRIAMISPDQVQLSLSNQVEQSAAN